MKYFDKNLFFNTVIIFCMTACITVDLQNQNSINPYNRYNSACITGDCDNGFGIKRNNDGLYIGNWGDSQKNGIGTCIYDGGDKFIGHWKNNVKDGAGKLIQKNGIWIGIWHDNKMINDLIFKSKDAIFTGKIDKLQTGHYYPVNGEIIWADGSKYIGNFGCVNSNYGIIAYKDCGVPTGEGEYISEKGLSIKGSFSSQIERKFFKTNKFQKNHKHMGVIKTKNGKFKYQLLINTEESPLIFKIINLEKDLDSK